MKKRIIIIVSSVVALGAIIALVCLLCLGKKEYVPSETFAEAYEALENACEEAKDKGGSTKEQYVDLEKTIRIMHSLEIAQDHCDSFEELMMHMAKEDYSGVAPEVLRAKQKLFPVMERLYNTQSQLDKIGSPMSFLKAMTESIGSKNTMMNILAITNLKVGIATTMDSAFAVHLEQQKIEKSLRKELRSINQEYIKYIEEYSTVYHKYMREWDSLCLLKDKAYIDCYSGRYADALNNAEAILEQHPNNADGLLLKSLALISLSPKMESNRFFTNDVEKKDPQANQNGEESSNTEIVNQHHAEADRTLDYYLEQHPGNAAPALLLKGMLNRQMGNKERAFTYFDQAAIEYPRQTEATKDMLNAYYNRAYLSQSAEGIYLLNYYCSTMEGYGIFSPNFQKAGLLIEEGKLEEGRQEIYKHFFRRGKQSAQDGLLFDMQFCETHLPNSLQSLFLASSYLDIIYEPSSVFLGMGSQKDAIDVTLRNRSDGRLENVRVFLCVHYTGMYTDDYTVIKIAEEKNLIEPFTEVVFKEVNLEGRLTSEITHLRAIVMTDNQIGWVDTPTMKLSKVLRRNDEQLNASEQVARNANYLRGMNLDAPAIKSLIAAEMRINGEPLQLDPITRKSIEKEHENMLEAAKKFFKNSVKLVSFGESNGDNSTLVELPRLLTLFSPVCTIYPVSEGSTKTIYAEKEVLDGGYIRASFNHKFEDNSTIPICVYGNCIAFRIEVKRVGNEYQLVKIEAI